MPNDRTRDNGHELKYKKFHLNIKHPFLLGDRPNRMLREVVKFPWLEIFKTQPNTPPGYLI